MDCSDLARLVDIAEAQDVDREALDRDSHDPPFSIWPGELPELTYCTKAQFLPQARSERIGDKRHAIARYGLLSDERRESLPRLLVEGATIRFVGDIDPLDLLVAAQVCDLAHSLGNRFQLSWYRYANRWMSDRPDLFASVTIDMSIGEREIWRRQRDALGDPQTLLGAAIVNMLDQGEKAELEGVVLALGRSRDPNGLHEAGITECCSEIA